MAALEESAEIRVNPAFKNLREISSHAHQAAFCIPGKNALLSRKDRVIFRQ